MAILKYLFLFSTSLSALPFSVGEKLYFRAHWKNIAGGYAMVHIVKKKLIGSRHTFHIRMRARSANYFDNLFKIRYDVSSFWQFNHRQPVMTTKKVTQGFNKRNYSMTFNWSERSVVYKSNRVIGNGSMLGTRRKVPLHRSNTRKIFKLPPQTQDLLTALYFMRSHEAAGRAGQSFDLFIFDDRVLKKTNITIVGKETIKTPLGVFDAWHVTSDFKTKGLLKSKGKVHAWVSRDKNRYPLMVKVYIPVLDHVQVDLVKIEKGS